MLSPWTTHMSDGEWRRPGDAAGPKDIKFQVFNISTCPEQRHRLVLNASISMQMFTSASADYLPLAAFSMMTFPPHVTALFAPLSCLSNTEPFFFMMLWCVCLNRIRALEAYKWDSLRGFMQNNILCVGPIRWWTCQCHMSAPKMKCYYLD